MFFFGKQKTSAQPAKRALSASRSQQSGSQPFGTMHSAGGMAPTGQRGVGQSNNYLNLDTSPLLSGFLSHREEKSLVDIYKDIYYYDGVAGVTADLMSNMPFSEFSLNGLTESEKAPFLESIERLSLRTFLPEMSIDYLVIGTFVGSLIFDQERRVFVDIMPQDFKNLDIESLPLRGFDPIITATFPKEIVKLFSSTHPRIRAIIASYGRTVVDKIKTGKLELDPLSTLYLPRKTMTSTEGISFFRRILPIYFLEKNIFRGTLMESIKRQRAILHITAGDQDWEPTEADLQYLSEMFENANMDPVGAIITTRTGIEPTEIRQGGDFWRIDDLWNATVPAKLRCLGISEAFLSGDATYNTTEAAMTSFMENLKDYRSKITRKVFYDRLFPMIALTNDFFVDDKARKLVDDMRNDTQDFAALMQKIQDTNSLKMPTISWNKSLEPEGDEIRIAMLTSMRDLGLPIPFRAMAAAGGMNIESLLESKEEDLKIAREISSWKKTLARLNPEGDMGASGTMVASEPDAAWVENFSNMLDQFAKMPDAVRRGIIGPAPYKSAVLNSRGRVPLKDRKFGEASEAYTTDNNGRRHFAIRQERAQKEADDRIIQVWKSIRKQQSDGTRKP